MEVAYDFTLSGDNMDFTLYRIRDGHLTPPSLFIDIMLRNVNLSTIIFVIQETI